MRLPCILGFLLLAFFSAPSWANMASPARAGQLNIEPRGLAQIAITRETLTIDFRSLPINQQAQVEALYEINNRAGAQNLALVFIAAAQNIQQFQVWFDGQQIPSQSVARQDFPAQWQAPRVTPGFNPGQEILLTTFPPALTKPLQFSVTIPTGTHNIKVQYQSALSFNVSGTPTKYWQFAYVLAPARDWASFGGLDLTVHLPPAYKHAVSLPLQQEGNLLRGNFQTIPADSLALTLQFTPPRAYQFANDFGFYFFVASFPMGLFFCLWCGRQQPRKYQWMQAFAAAFGWASLIVAAGYFALFGAEYFLPEKEIAHYGYGSFFQIIGLCILAIIVFAGGLAVYFLAATMRRSKSAA